jgi:hypothetical protein
VRRRRNASPPADAAARIEWAIESAEIAWRLKVAALRARDPDLTDEEIRAIALRSAIRNNAWQRGRGAR